MAAKYLLDCYNKEFETKVKKVTDRKYIVLEETYFYPVGGGQPHDTGKIVKDGEEYEVIFVKKFEDISHEVSKEGLKEGDVVKCVIDWDRRFTHMRYHTAAHILSNVISEKTGALITGNQLSLDKARIDFSLENYNPEKLKEYIEKANKIVEEGRNVNLSLLTKEQAKEELGDVFTTLAKGFDESITEVRVVEIEGFCKEACGGTHVKNTNEIGKLEFLKAKNKGKNNRRVEFTLKATE